MWCDPYVLDPYVLDHSKIVLYMCQLRWWASLLLWMLNDGGSLKQRVQTGCIWIRAEHGPLGHWNITLPHWELDCIYKNKVLCHCFYRRFVLSCWIFLKQLCQEENVSLSSFLKALLISVFSVGAVLDIYIKRLKVYKKECDFFSCVSNASSMFKSNPNCKASGYFRDLKHC
jgi:hypothetical protein